MAVRFDASTDRYQATSGLPTGGVVSATCWVSLSTDLNAPSSVWCLDQGGGSGVYNAVLGTDDDGITLVLWDTGFSQVVSAQALTVGAWIRVGVVLNGTSWTIYAGAETGALTSASGTMTSFGSPPRLAIGSNVFSEYFNGRVAAFKMWTAALTEAEIENELAQYQPVRTADLLRFHPFVNAELVDYSGNGNTLTAGGSATTTEAGPPIRWGTVRPRLILPAAASTVTGSLAGSLPPASGSLAGSASTSGAVAASLPALTGGLTGASAVAGAMAGQLPAAAGALSGVATIDGTLAANLPAPTGGLTATATAQGPLEATIPAVAGGLTGAAATTGALTGVLPAATGTLTGFVDTGGGTLTGVLPAPTGALTGVLSTAGALTGALSAPTLALAGDARTTGVLAGVLPVLVGAFTEAVEPGGTVQAGAPQIVAGPRALPPVLGVTVRSGPPAIEDIPRTAAGVVTVPTQPGPPAVAATATSGTPR